MLKNIADIKTILWMSAATALFFIQWNMGYVVWYLYIPFMYLAVTFSVFAHNHNHMPMWKNKALNIFTDIWITLGYGFPVFAWIPTHNKNHHLHNNKEKDYTKTYAWSERNNLLTLITYPSLSAGKQQKAVFNFYKKMYSMNRERFFFYTLQIVCLVAWFATVFYLDWYKAVMFVVIPTQFSLYSVLIFNYVQHIHADELSPTNHSRNIVGWIPNFFLFNNGLHTIHHDKPALHWSNARKEHNKIKDNIDPALMEQSFYWYIFRVYFLGIFIPKARTKSMRLARMAASKS